jgi:Arc/MetJ family transcription regulator
LCGALYTIHMKRTNLVLDEKLLEEATRIAGQKTYSGTVNFALHELIRLQKLRGLQELIGSGIWQGDLAEMREDRPAGRNKRKRRH